MKAEDAGELVLDGGGVGEHAVGPGPAPDAGVEQDGLADAGQFAGQSAGRQVQSGLGGAAAHEVGELEGEHAGEDVDDDVVLGPVEHRAEGGGAGVFHLPEGGLGLGLGPVGGDDLGGGPVVVVCDEDVLAEDLFFQGGGQPAWASGVRSWPSCTSPASRAAPSGRPSVTVNPAASSSAANCSCWAVGLRGEELLPAGGRAPRRGIEAGFLEDLPDGRGRDLVPETRQLAADPAVPPGRVVAGHFQREAADRRASARPSWCPAQIGPAAPDQLSVPALLPGEGLPRATTTRGTGPTMADPAGCWSAPDIWIAP